MNGIAAAAPLVTTSDSRRALRLVILLGVVSLFADMTYEGGRGIAGPFLAVLGASGTVVGLVGGLGELAGYGLRLWSGRLADRTHRYWTITIDTALRHHLDRERMNGPSFRARNAHVEAVAGHRPEEPFSHLTARGVVRAEDQGPSLRGSSPMASTSR